MRLICPKSTLALLSYTSCVFNLDICAQRTARGPCGAGKSDKCLINKSDL
ncbi:MAG: methylenetetrahydrofolate reductase C-terminal domain-containing protein [Bacteroidaceae bacterium]|nr:methylenetetrahydrofolate reductase C-terminal domain-containing protein [Bacteroidaceae bacterium]